MDNSFNDELAENIKKELTKPTVNHFKNKITLAVVLELFLKAPRYEFNKDVKVKGFFQKDLDKMGVPKALVKKLVRKNKIRYAHVELKGESKSNKLNKSVGTLAFYSLVVDAKKPDNRFVRPSRP